MSNNTHGQQNKREQKQKLYISALPAPPTFLYSSQHKQRICSETINLSLAIVAGVIEGIFLCKSNSTPPFERINLGRYVICLCRQENQRVHDRYGTKYKM